MQALDRFPICRLMKHFPVQKMDIVRYTYVWAAIPLIYSFLSSYHSSIGIMICDGFLFPLDLIDSQNIYQTKNLSCTAITNNPNVDVFFIKSFLSWIRTLEFRSYKFTVHPAHGTELYTFNQQLHSIAYLLNMLNYIYKKIPSSIELNRTKFPRINRHETGV